MDSLHNDTLAFIESIGLSSGNDMKMKKSASSSTSNKSHNIAKNAGKSKEGEQKKDNTRKWGKDTKVKKNQTESKIFVKNGKTPIDAHTKLPLDTSAKSDKTKQDLTWLKNTQSSTNCAIIITEDVKWYQVVQQFDNVDISDYRTSRQNIVDINASIADRFAREVSAYQKQKNSGGMSEDQKWMNEVIRSGTLSDKVAALALQIQQSPPHELETLDTLIGMALKKEQRTSQMALEALKDLLLHNLLPDRRLKLFKARPLGHPDLNLQSTLTFWFESELVGRVARIVEALENGMKSSVDFFKRKCMEIVSEWIIAKPEQEDRLLALLVNKLGDPSSKICAKAVSLLGTVVYKHPAMKSVVVREVRQLVSRPNLPPRATYSAVIFLSQMSLSTAEQAVAVQLVEGYVSLFEKAVTQEQLGSKLLAALLAGINRAFPFLVDKASLERNVDSLFKIAQTASFSSATQALTLISHLALGDAKEESSGKQEKEKRAKKGKQETDETKPICVENSLITRFYRSLYSKLLCDEILTRTHNTLFLNLLFRSMKRDPSDIRVMAFVKRLLLCTLHSTPPIAAGLVFLVSEVCKSRLSLRDDLLKTVETLSSFADKDSTYMQLGNFDASKRDALYACAAAPSAWELSLMSLHFHPSVQAFANSFLSAETGHKITYSGDPTIDFSLSSFLNRFSYKNPKKSQVDVRRRRSQVSTEDPMNMLASSNGANNDESVIAPDKMFFYKFFGERSRLRAAGKSRNRSRHKKSEDDDDDDDNSDLGSDFGEEAIDRFADKLADDLMQDNDDEDVIDDDDDDGFGGDDSDDEDGRFAGVDAEEYEEGDLDTGLQQWDDGDSGDDIDSDLDENVMAEGYDIGDDADSDDSALDFADYLEKQKGKQGGKTDVKTGKSKKRKSPVGGSVFATADSFEVEMEAAVAAHRGSALGTKASDGEDKGSMRDVKRRRKSKK